MSREKAMTQAVRAEPQAGGADATMSDSFVALGRAARAAARAVALASTDAKNNALRAAAGEIRRQSNAILAANALDVADAKARGTAGVLPRPADARSRPRRGDRPWTGGDRRSAGSCRPRSGEFRSPERPEDRARLDAAWRHRRDLRKPAQRHRRRRRSVSQGRQRRDSARRLGEPALVGAPFTPASSRG